MSRRKRDESAPVSLFSFQDLITSLSGILILVVLLMAIQTVMKKTLDIQPGPKTDNTATFVELRERTEEMRERVESLKYELEASQNARPAEDNLSKAERAMEAEKERDELSLTIETLNRECAELERQARDLREKEDKREREIQPLREKIAELEAAIKRATEQNELFFIPDEHEVKTPILVECSDKAIRAGFIGGNKPPVLFNPGKTGFEEFTAFASRFSTISEYFIFMIKPSGVEYWEILSGDVKRLGFDVGYDALEENHSIAFRQNQP